MLLTRCFLPILFGIVLATRSECKSVVKRSQLVKLIENDAPIIGVLTQELSPTIRRNFPGDYGSYIAASYIKFVEGAGARAVPIWIGKTREYYEDIMTKINGVLMPGGATFFNNTDGYADAGRMIYDIALDMNQNGVYMPLWGTCLGFELILYAATKGQEHRSTCNSLGQVLPLEFKNDVRGTRKLFSDASSDVLNILSTENVTYNWHQYCTTEETFKELGLDNEWRILTTDVDKNGLQFISTAEHKKYPFYGVQFHPEKNIYEWGTGKIYPHSSEAIRASQYFADFFVNECRKNDNQFTSEFEKLDSLIQNYSPTFSGRGKSTYYQMYFFEPNPRYGSKSEFVSKRAEWVRILKVEDLNKELLVGFLHFRKEDYTYPDANRSSRFLKKSAVPQSPTSRFCNLNNENINKEYEDEKKLENKTRIGI